LRRHPAATVSVTYTQPFPILGGSYSINGGGSSTLSGTMAETVMSFNVNAGGSASENGLISGAATSVSGTLTSSASFSVDVTLTLIANGVPTVIATLSAGSKSQTFSYDIPASAQLAA
jgi:hypothetical protein